MASGGITALWDGRPTLRDGRPTLCDGRHALRDAIGRHGAQWDGRPTLSDGRPTLWDGIRAYSHQRRVFFLLRIYQNPIHLNGTRWRTRFWRQREVRRRKNVVRQRAPFKCMYISAAEFLHQTKSTSLV